jgi:hypothetical protein
MRIAARYPQPGVPDLLVMPKIPLGAEGTSTVDIYVQLPASRRYVRWLSQGDRLTVEHLERLKVHVDPRLYCPVEQWRMRYKKMPLPEDEGPLYEAQTQELICDLFLNLTREDLLPEKATEQLKEISNMIVYEILVDLEDYEKILLQHTHKFRGEEAHHAIRSLAFLVAMANGHASRSAFMDITAATLLMDYPLIEVSPKEMEQILVDPAGADPHALARYMKHPAAAHFMVLDRFKNVSETTLQMILCHHELHNGHGFPRRMRTAHAPDMVKILSLAVDLYENWRRAEWHGQRKNLRQILDTLREQHIAAADRRHDEVLVKKLYSYLGLKSQATDSENQEPSL